MRSFCLSLTCLAACSGSITEASGGSGDVDGRPGTADAPLVTADAPLVTADAPIVTADARPGIDGAPGAADARRAIDAGPPPDAGPYPTVTLKLTQVATGLSAPIAIRMTPDPVDQRIFVAEQSGTISIIQGGTKLAKPFFDMGDFASQVSFISPGDGEQGLLGLAFHPDYKNNGRLFIYWTGDYVPGSDATKYDCHVWELHRSGSDANLTDGTFKKILDIPHPDTNHNGGNLLFGPDGKLYIGVGDGGGGGGQYGTTRILTTRLSKLLRIDVDQGNPYASPPDNPFASNANAAAKDIWLWGLRNPWRWSFDRQTGDLWIGDVGQETWEEIDFIPAGPGGNDLQWNVCEGLHSYPSGGQCSASGTPPVSEYSHSQSSGNAIIGGYVYRGSAIPEIQGMYFFSDNGAGFIRSFWSTAPVPFDQTKEWSNLHQSGVSTFGETRDGELLFCSGTQGRCWQITK